MKKITSRKKLFLYGCSGMGVNMLTLIVGSYLCSALLVGGFEEHIESWTYLEKDLVVATLWSVLVFVAKALDGIIDLPLASFADKLNTKFGRRKTAIVLGFIPMVIAYLLFLVPINKEATILNTLWFGLLLCIFYAFYTLTMLTFYATFSEICESERDVVFVSNIKSVCDVVYFSLGFALVPALVSMGVNVRMIALIFLPLSLTMVIPLFLLKESSKEQTEIRTLTLGKAMSTAFKNKAFMYWMFTISVMTVGLQLFLGGINEVFSSTGLNMTVVMACSFAPVPLTLLIYNKLVKKKGLAYGYRYILIAFSIGMSVMFACCMLSGKISDLYLTILAIFGSIFVSLAIGAFFSITYTVPSHLAQKEFESSGKNVASMLFAVQGVFEGVAAGIATGFILVALKNYNVIYLLPLVVIACCIGAFIMSFGFSRDVALMGRKEGTKKL